MRQQESLFVFGLSVLLSLPCGFSFAQVRGGVGGARIGGAPIRTNSARGLPSPRSGLGIRSNPIVNPAPSLTPSEVLNPRGSLNTGQVLNPKPSLNRPRSGGSLPAASDGKPVAAARYQAARQAVDGDTTAPSTTAATAARPAGEQLLEEVVALDQKLTDVAPDKGWSERLSLDELRGVPVFGEQPADDAARTGLEKILKAYQAVAKDEQSAEISNLPEFKATFAALQAYLSPLDVRQRQSAALSFQKLANDLKSYKNGAPWVEYLVPAELTTTNNKVALSKEQADKLLKRYDKLAANPDYNKVTALPGFKPAYDALKATVKAAKP